ncbi:MAG: hypothetical protein E7363_04895 [Clostridiales bacterium]|nr:hypothetical protein [Clostridiales bacterium]
MKSHEIYNLIVCLIVFVLLTGLLSYLIVTMIRHYLRMIKGGLEDEAIIKEFETKKNKGESRVLNVLDKLFPILVCVLLGVTLCFSLYSRFTANDKVGKIPTIKVVETGSMESKHPDNHYLFEKGINDQIHTFDAILLHELPAEDELKLYDIVVYETRGYYIIHRIVDIEEPNERHPNERWFVLRGDANKQADDFPVTYKQMKSIYRGKRLPFVGSFVFFMQSPAGMLCFLLVLFAMFATPIAEKKILEAKKARYALLVAGNAVQSEGEEIATENTTEEKELQEETSSKATKNEENRKNWVHPVFSWGLIGSFALLVLLVGLYFLLF